MSKRNMVLAVSAMVASGGFVALGPVSPASAKCASDRGWIYTVVSDHHLLLNGFGKPTIYHNQTGSTATVTKSQTSTGTSTWSVNGEVEGSGEFSFKVIEAGVKLKLGGSYSSSNSESQTVSATYKVPNKRYLVLQGGVFRRYTTGDYYYDDGNCHQKHLERIRSKISVNSDGQDAVVNKTGDVPWDQHNEG